MTTIAQLARETHSEPYGVLTYLDLPANTPCNFELPYDLEFCYRHNGHYVLAWSAPVNDVATLKLFDPWGTVIDSKETSSEIFENAIYREELETRLRNAHNIRLDQTQLTLEQN
jgi:hypothetical protein